MAKKGASARVSLLLLILGLLAAGSAFAGSLIVGSVAGATNASLGGQALVAGNTIFSGDNLRVSDGSAVVIGTEWNEFRNLDLRRVKEHMRGDLLVDARNIFDIAKAKSVGFRYYGIGRGGDEQKAPALLDPVSRAIASAPVDEEPESEAERLAVAESKAWFERHGGQGIPHEEVLADFGLASKDLKRQKG